MKYDVIIIGAGQAGLTTAVTLRQKKFNGSILLVGDERHLPYQRPPLSKSFIKEEIPEKRLLLKSKSYFEKNKIDCLSNALVISINRKRKNIRLNDGKEFHYGKLVICTGSSLKRLNLTCGSTNIHYLRTIEDSKQIKSTFRTQNKLVILGAGYIGLEIASVAINQGLDVTVIELQDKVMSRSVSSNTATFLRRKHEKAGVKFLFKTSVEDIEDQQLQKRIVCNDGTIIYADTVIIGVGISPNTELAIKSGLDCKDGILVDKLTQTSDINIYSSGDCTNHPNKIFKQRLRIESVQNAVEQSKIVASSIIGEETEYDTIPWFWSEQYNIKLQIAGISSSDYKTIVRGNLSEEKFAVYFFNNNKLKAIEAVNDQKSFMLAKKLIGSQDIIAEDSINNKSKNIRDWVKKIQ